jgi:hypothetical protein
MLARSSIKTRLSTLEAYVDVPKEPRGMTLTGRPDAQHSLLLALRSDFSDMNRRLTGVEERLTGVEERLTGVETRLGDVEVTLGTVLYGITEIKNLLRPPGESSEEAPPNGLGPPPG